MEKQGVYMEIAEKIITVNQNQRDRWSENEETFKKMTRKALETMVDIEELMEQEGFQGDVKGKINSVFPIAYDGKLFCWVKEKDSYEETVRMVSEWVEWEMKGKRYVG